MPIAEKHSLGLVPLSFSKMLERMTFFGMRSLFIMYAMRALEIPAEDVTSFYSTSILIAGLAPLLGGIIGDFVLNVRLAGIIGLALEALGCFIMAIPSVAALYVGLGCVMLGAGLYSPNSSAIVGFMYLQKKKLMDSAVTIFFAAINIGAVIAPLLMGLLPQYFGYTTAFLTCGAFALASLLLLVFSRNLQDNVPTRANIYTTQPYTSTLKVEWRVIFIVGMTIATGLYWLMLQITSNSTITKLYEFTNQHHATSAFEYLQLVNPVFYILASVVCCILWSFWNVSPVMKVAGGFMLFALSLLPMVFAGDDPSIRMLICVSVTNMLQGISEVFIGPIVVSFICQHGPPKVMSTLIATSQAISYAFFGGYSLLMAFIDKLSVTWISIFLFATALLIGVLFLVLGLVSRSAQQE